jgi:hypothetical protein
MSLVACSPLSPLLPYAIIQVSVESEQYISVSRFLNHLLLAFMDNRRVQDSGSGLFANTRNPLITGGAFMVSISRLRAA